MSHHRIAVVTIVTALAIDFLCGLGFAIAQSIPLWHGLYNALANAMTLGGDVPPTTPWGYITNTIECFTVIPLFAASIGFFTSGLAAIHIRNSERRLKDHLEEHLGAANR